MRQRKKNSQVNPNMMPNAVQAQERDPNPKDPMGTCRGTLENVCEQINLW